jgi:hypothetical protein
MCRNEFLVGSAWPAVVFIASAVENIVTSGGIDTLDWDTAQSGAIF